MNVVFISPNFPSYYYHFTKNLKDLGVNVLGIGDADYHYLDDNCKDSLNGYYKVDSLENYEEVYRAVAFFTFKYGKIDWIESQNEYWLELEAQLRSDFNVTSGTKIENLAVMKYKSKMKDVYESVGIKTARYQLVTSLNKAIEFVKEVGYPIVVKPDNGVGAISTFKIRKRKELTEFFNQYYSKDISYIMEEFIDGEVETFDGLTDSNKNILICSSHKMLTSIMDTVNESKEMFFINQAVSKASDIYKIGKKVVEAFDTRSRFYHFEFFRLSKDKEGLGKKGDLIGLEVNMRAPGGYIPEMINYSYDVDIYHLWAKMVVEDQLDETFKRQYFVGYASRRASFDYEYSKDELLKMHEQEIVLTLEVPIALQGAMGEYVFIFRAKKQEAVLKIMKDVLMKR